MEAEEEEEKREREKKGKEEEKQTWLLSFSSDKKNVWYVQRYEDEQTS